MPKLNLSEMLPVIEYDPKRAVAMFPLGDIEAFVTEAGHPFHAARVLPHCMDARRQHYERQMQLPQPEDRARGAGPRQPPSVQFMSQARARDLLLTASLRIEPPENTRSLSTEEMGELFACFSAKEARLAMVQPGGFPLPGPISVEAQARLNDSLEILSNSKQFQALGAAVAAGAQFAHRGAQFVQQAASTQNLSDLIRALNDGGANLEEVVRLGPNGDALMHVAVACGDQGALGALRHAGFTAQQLMQPGSRGSYTPLDCAAVGGKVQWIDDFLNAGLDREALATPNGDGHTLVHLAAVTCHAHFIRALGKHLRPEELMIPMPNGDTAAHLAADVCDIESINALADALHAGEVDPQIMMAKDQHGNTPLHRAVKCEGTLGLGEEERNLRHAETAAVIDSFFQRGVPREAALIRNNFGNSAFTECVFDRNLLALRSLWHSSLNPEEVVLAERPGGYSLAHYANTPEIVRFLSREAKMPLSLLLRPDGNGDTPIHGACFSGRVGLIEAWKEAGAGPEDFTRPNKRDQRPFDMVQGSGRGPKMQVQEALIKAGVPGFSLMPQPPLPAASSPRSPGPTL